MVGPTKVRFWANKVDAAADAEGGVDWLATTLLLANEDLVRWMTLRIFRLVQCLPLMSDGVVWNNDPPNHRLDASSLTRHDVIS